MKQVEEERHNLQILLEDQQFEAANLQNALADTSEAVQDLKTENSQLQSSLSQHGMAKWPVSRLCSFMHAVLVNAAAYNLFHTVDTVILVALIAHYFCRVSRFISIVIIKALSHLY